MEQNWGEEEWDSGKLEKICIYEKDFIVGVTRLVSKIMEQK